VFFVVWERGGGKTLSYTHVHKITNVPETV
jgi:hypothetical protein